MKKSTLPIAGLLVHLLTLPLVLLYPEEAPLKVVSLYASLLPVAALPWLLEFEVAEPIVAATCMSAVVRAHVQTEEVEVVGGFFDVWFYLALATSSKLAVWARVGAVIAAAGSVAVASALVTEGVENAELLVSAGEVLFFVGVLRVLVVSPAEEK